MDRELRNMDNEILYQLKVVNYNLKRIADLLYLMEKEGVTVFAHKCG